jgi:hypothetical protein
MFKKISEFIKSNIISEKKEKEKLKNDVKEWKKNKGK